MHFFKINSEIKFKEYVMQFKNKMFSLHANQTESHFFKYNYFNLSFALYLK